jgi:hypothetical protein
VSTASLPFVPKFCQGLVANVMLQLTGINVSAGKHQELPLMSLYSKDSFFFLLSTCMGTTLLILVGMICRLCVDTLVVVCCIISTTTATTFLTGMITTS